MRPTVRGAKHFSDGGLATCFFAPFARTAYGIHQRRRRDDHRDGLEIRPPMITQGNSPTVRPDAQPTSVTIRMLGPGRRGRSRRWRRELESVIQ